MSAGSLFRHGLVALSFTLAAGSAVAASPDTATSPDGRWRAVVKTDAGRTETGAGGGAASSLWLTDTRTGRSRLLFRGVASQTPRRDTVSIENPHFSLDGGYVYVDADAYATSSAVHQVNVRTGAERFVVDGGLVGVIRDGPWRGFLLVGQHRYRPQGGSYDPVVVFRPDGRQMLVIPGSDDDGERATAAWLRAKGWHAS